MKKMAISIAVIGIAASASAPAVADSVTLYGLIDEGISYISNAGGASKVYVRNGAWSGSRFGFRGNEDLGGGWSTIFDLESGFDITSGKLSQNGRLFGRQSYIGVNSPYGTLTIGRQYDAIADSVGPVMAVARGSSPLYDLDNAGADYRLPNAVKFVSQRYMGLQLEGMYGFGGVAGSFEQNSSASAGINYRYGPLEVGGAYTSIENPYEVYYDSTGASSIAIFGAYLPSAHKMNVSAIGAGYTVGKLTGRAGVSHTVLDQTASGDVQFNTYLLQADYMASPSLRLTASLDFTSGVVGSTSKTLNYRQYNLVADYLLSVRTDIYAWALWDVASGQGAVAAVGQLPGSSSQHQLNLQVGIRHRF